VVPVTGVIVQVVVGVIALIGVFRTAQILLRRGFCCLHHARSHLAWDLPLLAAFAFATVSLFTDGLLVAGGLGVVVVVAAFIRVLAANRKINTERDQR
jgi:hypothetical protein